MGKGKKKDVESNAVEESDEISIYTSQVSDRLDEGLLGREKKLIRNEQAPS